MRKPPPLHATVLGAGLFWTLEWATDNYLSQIEWLMRVPFGAIALFLLTFWAGVLAQDIYHPDSWLRGIWRDWTKAFEVEALTSNYVQTDPEHVIGWLFLRFIKDVTGELTMTVFHPRISPFLIYRERISTPANTDRKLTFCVLRVMVPHKPAFHSLWGSAIGGPDIKPGQKPIAGGRYVVRLTLKRKWRRRQHYDFTVEFRDHKRVDYHYLHLQPKEPAE